MANKCTMALVDPPIAALTFIAFSKAFLVKILDNFKLLQQGDYTAAIANILISVIGGIILAAVGWWLGKIIWVR